MAGDYPAEMLARCLKAAFDEVLDDHPEFEPCVAEFAVLMGEVLTTSPQFNWIAGNIWRDIDAEVQN